MSSDRSLGGLLRSGSRAALLASAVFAAPAAIAQTAGGSYTLSRVTFEGNSQVPTDELEAALPYKAGDTVDHAALQADADAVGAVYRKHNVGADISQRMTAQHGKAQLAYSIVEKAPVAPTVTHVGITADTVSVSGNKKVATAAILAAANIRPGDTVTNEKILAAQTAIQGLYKKANVGATINTDWTNAAPQHINLVFKISETGGDT